MIDRDAQMGDSFDEPVAGGKRKWWKTLLRYMFSHVGLCVLLGTYCSLGALLFIAMESGDEDSRLESRTAAANEITALRTNITKQVIDWRGAAQNYTFNGSNGDYLAAFQSYNESVTDLLVNYLSAIQRAINETKYDGSSTYPKRWTFPSALLFTVTIVTTIGYGNITPVTKIGQIVVIPYALVGIPLMLMFLANIGELLAGLIRMAYSRGCCYYLLHKRRENARKKPTDNLELFDSPDHDEDSAENMYASGPIWPGDCPQSPIGVQNIEPMVIERSVEQLPHIPVPISLTASLLITYVLTGAGIFWALQGWRYVSSVYFCFVTLATIGFGDFVPGWTTIDTLGGKFKLIVSAFYIVFGLAFLSMGFNLMVDELLERFRQAGKKMGIVNDEQDAEVVQQKCNLQDFVKRQVVKP